MPRLALFLAAWLALPCGPQAAPPVKAKPSDSLAANRLLHEGTYKMTLDGVLCNACTRLVAEETRKIKGVKEAEFDYEDGYLWVKIGKERKVRLTEIKRAIRAAARRLDLNVRFELVDVQFVPDSKL